MPLRDWNAGRLGKFVYDGDPNETVCWWNNLAALKRTNKEHGYSYFDADTEAFFGSTQQRMVFGALIECQVNAPDERWIIAWFDGDGDSITFVRLATEAEAIAYAKMIRSKGFVESR